MVKNLNPKNLIIDNIIKGSVQQSTINGYGLFANTNIEKMKL